MSRSATSTQHRPDNFMCIIPTITNVSISRIHTGVKSQKSLAMFMIKGHIASLQLQIYNIIEKLDNHLVHPLRNSYNKSNQLNSTKGKKSTSPNKTAVVFDSQSLMRWNRAHNSNLLRRKQKSTHIINREEPQV